MKQLIIFGIISLFTLSFVSAQQKQVVYKNKDKSNYSEYSLYIGYDIPLTDQSFNQLKFTGDIATGVSFHHYWDWKGIAADIGFAKNGMKSNFQTPINYYLSQLDTLSIFNYYDDDNIKLSKLFLGAGPSFKYQSKNKKFGITTDLMAGLGRVQKGEYVQWGVDEHFQNFNGTTYGIGMYYFGGFERQSVFAVKGQFRLHYYLFNDTSLFLGGYYTNFFNVKEGTNNELLRYHFDNSTIPNYTLYYAEPVVGNLDPPRNGTSLYLEGFDEIRSEPLNNPTSFNLNSFGVFAGFSVNVFKTKTETRCPSGFKLCSDGLCYENGNCMNDAENKIIVIVKDKISGKTLPGASVEIVKDNDQTSISSTTDPSGSVPFFDIKSDDYTLQGSYNGIALESSPLKKSEFKEGRTITKELLYNHPNFIVNGKATDCLNNDILKNKKVKFINTATAEVVYTTSDESGNYSISLPKANYIVEISDAEFFSEKKDLALQNLNRNTTASAQLDVCAQMLKCNSQMKFKNLLFDLNDYHITPNSTQELDNLVEYLQANTTVNLEVYAFTDSRGSDAYNLKLSQQRADETVKYLISKGIQAQRLTAKGFGETQLLNKCANGVECTENEHSINRRTEFKVVCP